MPNIDSEYSASDSRVTSAAPTTVTMRDGPAGAGEIVEPGDAPASPIHAGPPEDQHRHRRERRGQIEHRMADDGEAPVVRFQPDDQIGGHDSEDGVDVDHEHAAFDGRHRVDLEDRPAPEEGELVVPEPVHTDEAGEQQRHDEERGVAGGQEHGNERRTARARDLRRTGSAPPCRDRCPGPAGGGECGCCRARAFRPCGSRAVPAFAAPSR